MERAFDPTQMELGGHIVRGFSISCGKCGRVHKEHVNHFQSFGSGEDFKSQRNAKKKFEKHGWRVGRRSLDDRCPRCIEEEKTMTKVPNGAGGGTLAPLPAAVPLPKQMSRDDRRIIFEKLNEKYDKNSYVSGWTDKRIAEDLNCPRAWVTEVREQMFGPAGSNPEIDEQIMVAKGVVQEAHNIIVDLRALIKRFDVTTATLDRVERRLAEIEKSVR